MDRLPQEQGKGIYNPIGERLGGAVRGAYEYLKRSAVPALAGALALSGADTPPTHLTESKPALVAPARASGSGIGGEEWRAAHKFQPFIQERDDWCLVAAGEMSLRTVTGKRVSQSALVPLMGTDSPFIGSGTDMDQAAAALTTYTFKDGVLYDYTPVHSVGELDADLAYDIDTLEVAPIVAADMSKLPYDQGFTGNHALVAEAHNPDLKQVTVYDPEVPNLNGGAHTMTDQQLYDALLPGPGAIPYIMLAESVANPLKS